MNFLFPRLINSRCLREDRLLISIEQSNALIERFVKVCRSVAFALSEAWRFSYPSVGKLRSPNIIEVNSKLIRIANDMREIATELSQIIAAEGALYQKLKALSTLCTAISLNEDVLVVVLSTPKTLPIHLLESRDEGGRIYQRRNRCVDGLVVAQVAVDGERGRRPRAPAMRYLARYAHVLRCCLHPSLGRRHLAWRGLARPPIASERSKLTTVAAEVDCIPSRVDVWVDLTADLLPT
jgi:hypothetical protein